jgi:glucan phosphoethanolaminetransferase (alkaline phosphatase superfamily)
MWQRIQTLFLVIVIISLVASIFLPIWGVQEGNKTHELYPLHFTTTENGAKISQYYPYCLTAILAIASATLAFISVRKFKQRVVQMKLGALNSLFLMGTILSSIVFSNQLMKTFEGGQYGLGLWLPGVAVIFNLVANRFIRRDERLVRDSERLR